MPHLVLLDHNGTMLHLGSIKDVVDELEEAQPRCFDGQHSVFGLQ